MSQKFTRADLIYSIQKHNEDVKCLKGYSKKNKKELEDYIDENKITKLKAVKKPKEPTETSLRNELANLKGQINNDRKNLKGIKEKDKKNEAIIQINNKIEQVNELSRQISKIKGEKKAPKMRKNKV